MAYEVHYGFRGFTKLAAAPTFNEVKAGKVVSVRFDLGGDHGLGVLAAGGATSRLVTCDSSAPVDVVDEAADTVGGDGLSYDPDTGTYGYRWDTARSWSGNCRRFDLRLADGTVHSLLFSFR